MTMITLVLILMSLVSGSAFAAQPELVTFPSRKLTLSGFIYKPKGVGPFPAVLYNHGSERKPGWKPELGELFSEKGYVFFVPHRRGHGRSPDDSRIDSLYSQGVRGEVALHEIHLEDQLAALSYLKGLPYVDTNRIAVAGCSYGGIQTILAVEANAEMNLGLKGAVDFAGAAMTWARAPNMRNRLLSAVRKATIPILFVQAENDYDLGPSRALAKELERLGTPHKVAIFPPYGRTAADGHGGFCFEGGDVWGAEVLSFLASAMSR